MALFLRPNAVRTALPRELIAACTISLQSLQCRNFSVLNRPPPNYPGHIPLTRIEKAGLAVGSAIMALRDPFRGDLIAALGEATATPYFIYRLHDAMLSSPTGRRILKDRPRISSKTMSMDYLRKLPENTVGRAYADWLDREGVSPDTRSEVQYIDDEECAYVMQRYRECHDFYHALTGLPIVREGEVALKAFEFANTLLPMTGLSMFAVTTLKKKERERFWKIYLPWAVKNGVKAKEVINVYWEEELENDVEGLRNRLGIEKPVDLREIRAKDRARRKAEKEAKERAGDTLGIN
ncbi:probable Ubiquinone biosynthesis protein coq4, mitochondrial [Phialocephala subalpina]|uniref:4-hydroxy-3-methoxy-5-polyprenylbenzoate decarboxylase n=1 Tax=Phialocephala subalpina TaxID=576137 RepID=A0A1L7X094_9HELO|nr:probable Ubiquinone biosynthesis protein coq4, mitochondrial [Phialocephala subalpina]